MSRTIKKQPYNFTKSWGNKAHRGKRLKRRFHKAERKAAHLELNGFRPKSISAIYSEVSWRGW